MIRAWGMRFRIARLRPPGSGGQAVVELVCNATVIANSGCLPSLPRLRPDVSGLSRDLSFYGIAVPDDIAERHWPRRYTAYLEALKFQSDSGTMTLQVLLKELAHHRETLLSLTRMIRQLATTEPYALHVRNLVGIPGISTLTAMILLTELVEMAPFHSLDRLASYVGLVPGENSSGDDRTITGITVRKNPSLRWILIECAWVAVQKEPVLMQAFAEFTKRMTKNRAIIRIARKSSQTCSNFAVKCLSIGASSMMR